MNNETIAYSSIVTLSYGGWDVCCGERRMVTPCCEIPVCVLCEDSCDECGAQIDWTA